MKILVLAPDIPATSKMPGSPRLFNLCRELSRQHELYLLTYCSSGERHQSLPGGVVPAHSHPHEQGGVCLEGAMEFTIGVETRIVRRGEGWMIPGGVMHAVRALGDGATALDIFYPHREDYK